MSIPIFFLNTILVVVSFSEDIYQSNQSYLTVHAVGTENNKGKLILDIFDSEKGYPMDTSEAMHRYTSTIKNNEVIFKITSVPLKSGLFKN